MKLSTNLQLAITAAKEAGKIVHKGFGNIADIQKKEKGKGIVTDVDKKSETIIIDVLSKSKHSILAEESGLVGQKSETYWVVDPIDGTNNFSRSVPLIAISISLIRENKVVVGVTYNPLLNLCFFAEKGKGAFRNEDAIKVSKRSNKEAIIVIDHGYDKRDLGIYREANSKLLDNAYRIRCFGTTALEMCYVAQGSYEGFLTVGDELWDYAAGLIIVEEAGGKVTDWKGNPWNNSNSFILATNGIIHEELIEQISDLQTL